MASKCEDDDDDIPQLSEAAAAALREFISDQENDRFIPDTGGKMVTENWQLSQFWYDATTADALAKECLSGFEAAHQNQKELSKSNSDSCSPYSIICVSSPTAFNRLNQLIASKDSGRNQKSPLIQLLEFDRRFGEQYGEEKFHFYDYNRPIDLPPDRFQQKFDVILADPPFLSKECITKTAETIKWLRKSEQSKIIVCTGAVMEQDLGELLQLKMIKFQPKHANNLANEFRCYTNFEPNVLDN